MGLWVVVGEWRGWWVYGRAPIKSLSSAKTRESYLDSLMILIMYLIELVRVNQD